MSLKMNREDQDRLAAIAARNAEADAAYEAALPPSRLGLKNENRVPYTQTVPQALAAYDTVIAKWRGRIFK